MLHPREEIGAPNDIKAVIMFSCDSRRHQGDAAIPAAAAVTFRPGPLLHHRVFERLPSPADSGALYSIIRGTGIKVTCWAPPGVVAVKLSVSCGAH